MPTADISGSHIYYRVVGNDGPWVVVLQGGRHPHGGMLELAAAVAAHGFRVLLHDRRNCGRSGVDFETNQSEDAQSMDDLQRLLKQLKIERPILVGNSSGARIAARYVLEDRSPVRSLMLWSISGGPIALRFLDNYYFGQYLRACASGGMEAVCRLGHFAGLINFDPQNREKLMGIEPARFAEVLNAWRDAFLVDADQRFMGIGDGELTRIVCPTIVVSTFDDKMHPVDSSLHTHQLIANSQFAALTEEHSDKADATTAVCNHLVSFERSLKDPVGH